MKRLFGLTAESNNGGIEFILGSTRTIASSEPYQVDILQAAEQASVLATNTIGSSIVIDSSNNEFTLEVNGVTSETLTLSEGLIPSRNWPTNWKRSSTAPENWEISKSTFPLEGDQIEIRSTAYGLSSTIDQISGTAAATLVLPERKRVPDATLQAPLLSMALWKQRPAAADF